MDLKVLCYKFYLIPDYSPTESMVINCSDHAMGDGISGISMIALMQPSEDFSGLRTVASASMCTQFLQTLMAPFTVPLIFHKFA
jgi:stress-induced morphogen